MAPITMLSYAVKLDQQPGGISPEIHLKQGMSAVRIRLLLFPRNNLIDVGSRACVVKATLPDGTPLLTFVNLLMDYGELTAALSQNQVRQMASVAGKYRATLTILDSAQASTKETYMDRDFHTVLPFTVIVHEAACEKEED